MVDFKSDYEGFGSRFLSDHSTLFLIISNLILIAFAFIENWDLLTIMFIYWCQSIIIGFFTFLKMLTLKEFSTEGINDNTLAPTTSTKIFMSFFFLIHYGGFHFGYYIFLRSGMFSSTASSFEIFNFSILVVIFIFFLNHLFSFLYNRKKDADKKPNIGHVMLFPYARIIPMHLTIIFGGALITTGQAYHATLLLFLLLKTFADVMMHSIEHRGAIANQMKIDIDKTSYSPGENIRGELTLNFDNPIKARLLTISFIAEKRVISGSGDSRSTKKYVIHKSEKTFNEQEYWNNVCVFDFQIPSNILTMINNFEVDYYLQKTKEFAKKHPRWSIGYREFDSFYIQATLDIPYRLNISNKKEIIIL